MPVKVRRIQKIEVDAPLLHIQLEQARVAAKMSVSAVCREAEISRNYWYRLTKEKEKAIAEPLLSRLEQVLSANFGVFFEGKAND